MDALWLFGLVAIVAAYYYFAHYRPTVKALDPEVPTQVPSEEPVPLPDDVPLTQPVDHYQPGVGPNRNPNVQIP